MLRTFITRFSTVGTLLAIAAILLAPSPASATPAGFSAALSTSATVVNGQGWLISANSSITLSVTLTNNFDTDGLSIAVQQSWVCDGGATVAVGAAPTFPVLAIGQSQQMSWSLTNNSPPTVGTWCTGSLVANYYWGPASNGNFAGSVLLTNPISGQSPGQFRIFLDSGTPPTTAGTTPTTVPVTTPPTTGGIVPLPPADPGSPPPTLLTSATTTTTVPPGLTTLPFTGSNTHLAYEVGAGIMLIAMGVVLTRVGRKVRSLI